VAEHWHVRQGDQLAAPPYEHHQKDAPVQYHMVSHNEYLVLSVEGVDKYKKVDDKLVER
jgi:hypothetical protein